MRPKLDSMANWGALDQVWFVRNYYTLIFEDEQRLSVSCNSEVMDSGGNLLEHGDYGFSDALVGCIESSVLSVKYERLVALEIQMSSGSIIRLKLSPKDIHGPEAFEITGDSELGVYIEFNA